MTGAVAAGVVREDLVFESRRAAEIDAAGIISTVAGNGAVGDFQIVKFGIDCAAFAVDRRTVYGGVVRKRAVDDDGLPVMPA